MESHEENKPDQNQPLPHLPPPNPKKWYERTITDWITAGSTLVIMVWAGLQWYEMHWRVGYKSYRRHG
jgi:hypothetical protein